MRTRYYIAVALVALGAATSPAAASGEAPAGWTKVSEALADSCKWQGANAERRGFLYWRVDAPTDQSAGRAPGQSSLPVLACVASADEVQRTGRCVAQRYSNALILDTPRGELEGLNAGEWGGALIWKGVGQEHVTLLQEPIRDMLATRVGVLVFGGLNHMGGRRGAVWRVDIGADGRASAQLTLRLFTSPAAISAGQNRSAIVATYLGVIRVTPDGKGKELFRYSPKVPPMAGPGERHPLANESLASRPRQSYDQYTWNPMPGVRAGGNHAFYSIVEMKSGTIWATTIPRASSISTATDAYIHTLHPALLVRFDRASPRFKATYFLPPNCRVSRNGSGTESCDCEPD
jgi:hypothetical protein